MHAFLVKSCGERAEQRRYKELFNRSQAKTTGGDVFSSGFVSDFLHLSSVVTSYRREEYSFQSKIRWVLVLLFKKIE